MLTHQVFFISDGTGLTAEMLGNSLISQFDNMQFKTQTFPYIDTHAKAQAVVKQIEQANAQNPARPLVFTTLVNPDIRACFTHLDCCLVDLFGTFIQRLESELQSASSHSIGRSHGVVDIDIYNERIEAINYALACDDGLGINNYDVADVIVVGASRSGKTPSSLYLALQFGIFVANYPITSDDDFRIALPKALQGYKNKIYGLTISPERLHQIREERRPGSQYAALATCIEEIRGIEQLFHREGIKFLNTTANSIEEIATRIMADMTLKRRCN